MTTTELQAFRRALENRQTELGNRNRNREAFAIDTSPDELDRIQQAGDCDFAISNLERNFSRLHEVRTALRSFEAGTFGNCVDCGENIDPKRLAAVPWASSCIACQEAAERAQKTSRSELDTSLVMAA